MPTVQTELQVAERAQHAICHAALKFPAPGWPQKRAYQYTFTQDMYEPCTCYWAQYGHKTPLGLIDGQYSLEQAIRRHNSMLFHVPWDGSLFCGGPAATPLQGGAPVREINQHVR